MQKTTVTYNAPKGDSKVAEVGGVTFFDGQPVEINSDDHGHLMNKLPNNPHFEVGEAEEVTEDDATGDEPVTGKKRGRKSKDNRVKSNEPDAN